jgi:hypothetical protein
VQSFLLATGLGLIPIAIIVLMVFLTLEREDRRTLRRHPIAGLREQFARQNDAGPDED